MSRRGSRPVPREGRPVRAFPYSTQAPRRAAPGRTTRDSAKAGWWRCCPSSVAACDRGSTAPACPGYFKESVLTLPGHRRRARTRVRAVRRRGSRTGSPRWKDGAHHRRCTGCRPPLPLAPHADRNHSTAAGAGGHTRPFDVADAAALPWPDSTVDLVVTSPPYGVGVDYMGGDVPDYAAWLVALKSWLAELYRVAQRTSGRLCLNVPLDRDRGGWQPVSADAIQVARAVGWQFRTWLLWDKLQAGAGTDRGSIDSAAAPNVTAPVESVLVFYRGAWQRSGPRAMPHQAWLDVCGPRGLWRFPGTTDPDSPAPFPEELPE